MKFCNWLTRAINLEHDAAIPCCSAYSPSVPRFSYQRPMNRAEYSAFIRESAMAANASPPGRCRHCEYLQEVGTLPPLVPKFRLLQINKHRFLCNLKCIYCELWKTPKVPEVKILPYIRQMIEQGMLADNCMIDWAGGEPTILAEFEPITRLLWQEGYTLRFYTNALHYSPLVSEVLRSGRGIVVSSPDAGSREVFLAIKGKDRFDKVWANLSSYCEAGPGHIELKYVLCKQNCRHDEIERFLTLCSRLGVGRVYLSLRMPIMRQTAADIYAAAAFFMRRGESMGLNCEAQAIPPSHLAVIEKARSANILDAPPLLREGGEASLFWGATDKAEVSPRFKIGAREDFERSLQAAALLRVDASLRQWPGAFFFDPPAEADLTQEDYERRAALVRLRSVASDADFAAAAELGSAEIDSLFTIYLAQKHAQSLQEQAVALQGKAVYFWGHDEAYDRYGKIFAATRPRAILVNADHDPGLVREKDGIPVVAAQKELVHGPVLPIVIFAKDAYMKWVVAFIEEHYPHYGGKNLLLCRHFETDTSF